MINKAEIPRIIIAGTHSGVGKTTVAIGLMAALAKRGYKVQPFKVGPDYIDPSYHTKACGRVSRNLDSWMVPEENLLKLFVRGSKGAHISVIEGVMGLYDGLDGNSEAGSTAEVAKLLRCPVILVIDAAAMARSAAAVLLGYQKFDLDLNLVGVIFNNVGSLGHLKMLRQAVKKYAEISVLGFLTRNERIKLPQRHLGLIPTAEDLSIGGIFSELVQIVEKNIDLEQVLRFACHTPSLTLHPNDSFPSEDAGATVRIGVARDEAFNFYYQDNIDLLKAYGAEIKYFSPLNDSELPEVAGIYIGGGFPELFAEKLASNNGMKLDLKKAIMDGVPTYAECGGFMYLTKAIVDFQGRSYQMVGVIPFVSRMQTRCQALGYVIAKVLKDNILAEKGEFLRGHQFRWSMMDGANNCVREAQAYQIKSKGKVEVDGFVNGSLLASYMHLHFWSKPQLARNFAVGCAKG
jgi:cobyrinic acid a,c-diamide synthase